ncbi:MAG: hypothetical protein CVU54_14665 [Deltaproteobacteria bacterium HGW-Deltaproteobacteria-12]|nr:MAG: hypothetical protein CVU54_14665 [Deltaproteobacteria bacterium HGW-Deltaproteobacteria-12]
MRYISQSFFLIDSVPCLNYCTSMAKITYNTRLEEDLVKKFKILAIEQGKRQNDILEEAIQDLLKKYEKQTKKK